MCGVTNIQGEEKLKGQSHGQCKAIQELAIDGDAKITFKGVQMALLHLPDLKILKSSLVFEALRATHQNELLICAKYACLAEGILSLICVALLWGVTNPLMGKGSSGIQKVKHPNFLVQFGSELQFLLLNWKVSLLKCPLSACFSLAYTL